MIRTPRVEGSAVDIGIGLPNHLAGTAARELIDWAAAAEQRGFSVLGSIGRIVFHTHEELVAFAAAAAVTDRIALMSTVLVGPPRQTALLAKQAATLDHLSEGRFRLGLGTSSRPDDYTVLGRSFTKRGAQVDRQLDDLQRIWNGEVPEGAEIPVGPPPFTPGGPPIALGGRSEKALQRAGRRASAWIASPGPPEEIAQMYAIVRQSAEQAGRPAPAFHAARYFALGADKDEEVRRNVTEYYSAIGPEAINRTYDAVLRDQQSIRDIAEELEALGVAELCLWPYARGLDQVKALAETFDL